MNKIAAFLTLILVIAWAYTSWYWYTCNIKGLCNDTIQFSQNDDGGIGRVINNESDVKNEDSDVKVEGWNSETISSDDVSQNEYSETPVEESENVSWTEESEDTTENIDSSSSKQEEEDTSNETQSNDWESTEDTESADTVATLCESPLIGPIAFGGNNNVDEVKRLEKFLQSQGVDIQVDGKYGTDDFEAVKDFQLKYRADILDPWDISNPTGYVYRTTVKKINEVACQ